MLKPITLQEDYTAIFSCYQIKLPLNIENYFKISDFVTQSSNQTLKWCNSGIISASPCQKIIDFSSFPEIFKILPWQMNFPPLPYPVPSSHFSTPSAVPTQAALLPLPLWSSFRSNVNAKLLYGRNR